MPFLALTRAGVSSVVQDNKERGCLWLGSDVLSSVEVLRLRAVGIEISVFTHKVRTQDEVEAAIPVLREHHPNEPVWIESLPDKPNPRSSDIGQSFLWREFIVGVNFKHDDAVAVSSGPHTGEQGNLVALLSLEPEPEYILEAWSGRDIHVYQSSLTHADA